MTAGRNGVSSGDYVDLARLLKLFSQLIGWLTRELKYVLSRNFMLDLLFVLTRQVGVKLLLLSCYDDLAVGDCLRRQRL